MTKSIKVGLTGGIGTGKTLVAQIFETYGIPVLYTDDVAKKLMKQDATLINQLTSAFGNDIYKNGILDRKLLSNIVFNNHLQLQILNNIVHPAVIKYCNNWLNNQHTRYVIKEAAIIIESGSRDDLDYLIGVTAPKAVIIDRVIKRDKINREEVLKRMDMQMDNEEKMKYCDVVILNDNKHSLITQCYNVHQTLLNHKINESDK